jgi:hypothetical protein
LASFVAVASSILRDRVVEALALSPVFLPIVPHLLGLARRRGGRVAVAYRRFAAFLAWLPGRHVAARPREEGKLRYWGLVEES